ncbi:hypothetical protein V2J09_009012 [Rumex salicifolius]
MAILLAVDEDWGSRAKMYLLLLGTTAFSLVTAPILFKLMPAVMHFGVLMHWFPSESIVQNEDRASVTDTHNRYA